METQLKTNYKKWIFIVPLFLGGCFIFLMISAYKGANEAGQKGLAAKNTDRDMSYSTSLDIQGEAGMAAPTNAGGSMNVTDRKIIKNGDLFIYVNDINYSLDGLKRTVGDLKGYVDSINISNNGGDQDEANVQIRVPVARFDDAMNSVKKLAAKVDSENVSTSDATAQYVELSARLKNLRSQETQLQKIMEKATSVQDVLSVANQLAINRGEIEVMQAQLNLLNSQIEMSTINVRMYSEADVRILGVRWKPVATIRQSLHNMLEDLTILADSLISFFFALPVIILWLGFVSLLLWIGWKIILFIYRKFFKINSISKS